MSRGIISISPWRTVARATRSAHATEQGPVTRSARASSTRADPGRGLGVGDGGEEAGERGVAVAHRRRDARVLEEVLVRTDERRVQRRVPADPRRGIGGEPIEVELSLRRERAGRGNPHAVAPVFEQGARKGVPVASGR